MDRALQGHTKPLVIRPREILREMPTDIAGEDWEALPHFHTQRASSRVTESRARLYAAVLSFRVVPSEPHDYTNRPAFSVTTTMAHGGETGAEPLTSLSVSCFSRFCPMGPLCGASRSPPGAISQALLPNVTGAESACLAAGSGPPLREEADWGK